MQRAVRWGRGRIASVSGIREARLAGWVGLGPAYSLGHKIEPERA